MQNLNLSWLAGAAQQNPFLFTQPFLDFGIYQQHALQEKILAQAVATQRAKKSFMIDSILSNDTAENDLKRIASHPYFPAIQLPLPTPQQIQQELSMSRNHRNKRIRTIFTHEQLEALEKEFSKQQYMVGSERYYLANKLQLTEAQVKVWFQNRRIKWRKQNLEGGKVSDLHDFYNVSTAASTSSETESDTCSDASSDAGSV